MTLRRTTSRPVRLTALATASALAILTLAACSKETDSTPRSSATQPEPVSSGTAQSAPSTTASPAANARSDTLITADVKTSLLADDMVKGQDISVTTDGGEVRLTGTIESEAQRDQALALARRIDGVRQVRDETKLRN